AGGPNSGALDRSSAGGLARALGAERHVEAGPRRPPPDLTLRISIRPRAAPGSDGSPHGSGFATRPSLPPMKQPAPLFPDANDPPAPATGQAVGGAPTLYILDAYSLIYQVFHAIPQMAGPAGQPTNAVFGIVRDLLNLVRDRKPDHLAAAFDG